MFAKRTGHRDHYYWSMWFFSQVFKWIYCPSSHEIFSWLLWSNGKHVALCFYMCRCASVLGKQICFQINSTFWLILARAYRMTCILAYSLLIITHWAIENVEEKVSETSESWPFPLHSDIAFEQIALEKWAWSQIDCHWISLLLLHSESSSIKRHHSIMQNLNLCSF